MSAPLLLVTVGSDHHPFQRLVDQVDAWAAAHPDWEVVVQYGTSRAPRTATGHPFLGHSDLQALMARAAVVVTQGGPTGIVEVRRHGKLPVVVPRRHDLGEHVDDHQGAFCRHMAIEGRVRLAQTAQELEEAIAAATSDDDPANRVDPGADADEIARSAKRFGELVADLGVRRARRVRS